MIGRDDKAAGPGRRHKGNTMQDDKSPDDERLVDWLKDELSLVSTYLGDTARSDVQRVRQAMSEVRRAVGDWLLLDGEALRRKLIEVSGHDEVPELVAFMERIDPQRPFLMTGERVLAATFRCLVCGELIERHASGELPSCVKCGGEFFQEV